MHYELEKRGKRSIFLKNYWRYYLLLERRFQDCEQYVEISEAMLKCNAPALLLSYMRPIVANITNVSKFPVYNLPFVNFQE